MVTQRVIALIGVLLLAGCAADPQRQKDMAAVSSSGVPTITSAKMEYNQPIDLNDIIALSKQKVSDDIILRYLKARRTIYSPDPQALERLRAAGVSQGVINYILSTPSLYAMDRDRQIHINQSTEPVRDPLLNGQAAPRGY